MPWKIYWDNGAEACGTFSNPVFEDEAEAEPYAESLTQENIAQGVWDETGGAEPIWVEPPSDCSEAQAAIEQSLEYFDRYVAGDR